MQTSMQMSAWRVGESTACEDISQQENNSTTVGAGELLVNAPLTFC